MINVFFALLLFLMVSETQLALPVVFPVVYSRVILPVVFSVVILPVVCSVVFSVVILLVVSTFVFVPELQGELKRATFLFFKVQC